MYTTGAEARTADYAYVEPPETLDVATMQMRWTTRVGLIAAIAIWCPVPPQSVPLSVCSPAVAAVRQTPDSGPTGDRGQRRVRAGIMVLVGLGIAALAVVALGLFMVTSRWARRTGWRRRGSAQTEVEDLWAAAGKKDLPLPPEDEDD